MKLTLNHMSAAEEGDYYQVLFEAQNGVGAEYFLLQRQFEDPDGGVIYIESHDQAYIGHYKVERAELSLNRFFLRLKRKKSSDIEVFFRASPSEYCEVSRALKIMIPFISVLEG